MTVFNVFLADCT